MFKLITIDKLNLSTEAINTHPVNWWHKVKDRTLLADYHAYTDQPKAGIAVLFKELNGNLLEVSLRYSSYAVAGDRVVIYGIYVEGAKSYSPHKGGYSYLFRERYGSGFNYYYRSVTATGGILKTFGSSAIIFNTVEDVFMGDIMHTKFITAGGIFHSSTHSLISITPFNTYVLRDNTTGEITNELLPTLVSLLRRNTKLHKNDKMYVRTYSNVVKLVGNYAD